MGGQLEIDGAATPRANHRHDYLGHLPDRVMPTVVEILERNGHVLMIRNTDNKPAPAQARIWNLMPLYGKPVDAPGSITVCHVTRPSPNVREVIIYDHLGVHEFAWTKEEFGLWLEGWWKGASL